MEPKHSSIALRDNQAERLAQATIDALNTHICVVDEKGTILEVNEAWRKFGRDNPPVPEHLFLGENYLSVCDHACGPDSAEAAPFAAGLRGVLEGRRPEFELEYPCHSPGDYRWFVARITRLAGPVSARVVVAHDNITERKLAVEALRASEERYRSLVAGSLDAVLLTQPDGTILSANEAACRMFGWSEKELTRVGRNGVVDQSDPRLVAALKERADMGRFRGELLFVRKDGTKFPGEISSAVFSDRDGKMRASTVIRDIAERTRAQEELLHSREALRALAARMDKLSEETLTRVSRDIHDQLGHAFTDLRLDFAWLARRLAEEGMDGRSAVRRKIAAMSRRAEICAQTVRQIATHLRPPVLDALGLAAAIEWQLREFQQRTGVKGKIETPGPMFALERSRSTAMFRIFQEILNNIALHASASRVRVRLTEAQGRLVLRVTDDGCGITEMEQSSPISLGLLGMRERAASLGGDLDIRSSPRQGTTVTVSIPILGA